jgi:hypothetical protein
MLNSSIDIDRRGVICSLQPGAAFPAVPSAEPVEVGELTTYLNDAVLLAPSMLLGLATTWSGVDDHTFDVSLSDAARTVTGRVFIDDRGAPRDFSTTDRFADLPGGLVRAEWRTPDTELGGHRRATAAGPV